MRLKVVFLHFSLPLQQNLAAGHADFFSPLQRKKKLSSGSFGRESFWLTKLWKSWALFYLSCVHKKLCFISSLPFPIYFFYIFSQHMQSHYITALLSLFLLLSASSVCRENWPHKKWKGLFKRKKQPNENLLLSHNALHLVAADGLVSDGGDGWISTHFCSFISCLIVSSLSVLIFSHNPRLLFSAAFLIFCFFFISSLVVSSLFFHYGLQGFISRVFRHLYEPVTHSWSITKHRNDLLCTSEYMCCILKGNKCVLVSVLCFSGWWEQRGITSGPQRGWVVDVIKINTFNFLYIQI